MNKIKIQYYKSSIGELLLGSYENKLCIADYRYRKMRTTVDSRIQKGLKAEYVEEPSEVVTHYAGGLDVKKRLLEIERNLFV